MKHNKSNNKFLDNKSNDVSKSDKLTALKVLLEKELPCLVTISPANTTAAFAIYAPDVDTQVLDATVTKYIKMLDLGYLLAQEIDNI